MLFKNVPRNFKVQEAYTFEVGVRSKGRNNIKGIDNVYVAADGLETGFTNNIPFWLSGFLY